MLRSANDCMTAISPRLQRRPLRRDEAHCFSSCGVRYFLGRLPLYRHTSSANTSRKGKQTPDPGLCFTAAAKQKVIQDIRDYFKQTLDLNLELFASKATRTNLSYSVLHVDNDEEKYQRLRELIADSQCPTIVYVSRTRRTRELASRLTHDGFRALPFNGKMDSDEKITNQEAFMNDHVRIIVATSAFGMGVDKSDVGLVIHYDISDSLENYVQEAGRAGRNPHLHARCYVLYGDSDLDKHFILLNQTKLSIGEIQQVWKAVKELTRQRMRVNSSALEIAHQAGWDGSGSDIETRVRTALAALMNRPATSNGVTTSPTSTPRASPCGISTKPADG
ncbi:MAG: helicase-related protein [Alistipes shahii]